MDNKPANQTLMSTANSHLQPTSIAPSNLVFLGARLSGAVGLAVGGGASDLDLERRLGLPFFSTANIATKPISGKEANEKDCCTYSMRENDQPTPWLSMVNDSSKLWIAGTMCLMATSWRSIFFPYVHSDGLQSKFLHVFSTH